MKIGTKSLSDLINKVLEKQNKVNERMSSLQTEIVGLNEAVQEKVQELLDAELSDDVVAQDRCRKELKRLRNEIEDNKGLLNAYKNKQKGVFLTEGEAKKIKEAALKIKKTRTDKIAAHYKKMDEIDQEITKLTNQRKQISSENERLSNAKEEINALQAIINVLDPQITSVSHLAHFEKEAFIKQWIMDHSIEKYIRKENR